MTLFLAFATIVASLAVLIWSADRFILGAAQIAESLGVSQMMIGLTIVAFGTSAPEMLVALSAALAGDSGLAVGNAIGSNIANIGLVLGVTALFCVVPVSLATVRQELPVLVLVTALIGGILYDNTITLANSLLIIAILLALFYALVQQKKSEDKKPQLPEALPHINLKKAVQWFVLGLVLLVLSAKALVWGASSVARIFNVSDVIIGLTIVAIGTSLPELAASVTSALKKHHDIALGTVIGSNILNLLAVLPIPGLVSTTVLEPAVFYRDYTTMAFLTGLLTIMAAVAVKRQGIGRIQGATLLSLYFGYLAALYVFAIKPLPA